MQLFPIDLKSPMLKKSYFENQSIRLGFSIVDRNAQDAPQKNPLNSENSWGYPHRGSPAAAAEAVY